MSRFTPRKDPVKTLVAAWQHGTATTTPGPTKFLIHPITDDGVQHIARELASGDRHEAEQMHCGIWIEIDEHTKMGIIVRATGEGSQHLCPTCAARELRRMR